VRAALQPTRFCIVRHGETAWNAEGRVQGQLDVPLSQAGIAQAHSASRLERLAEAKPAQSLLVFTHGGVLEMLYRHTTSRHLSARRDFDLPNAAVNRLEWAGGRWRVLAWADVSHLEAALDDLPD
jgi:broad specificity phosphatase PhoE